MDDRRIEVLMQQAEAQRRLGNHRGAIEHLQRALAIDPDHARAHAALGQALLGARRLAGARLEVRAALALDSDDPFVHHVAAAVHRAARELADAWAHCLIALEDPGRSAATLVLAAEIRILQRQETHARELLGEALALDPSHVGALTSLARMDLVIGELVRAAQHAAQALESDPVAREAHVVAGAVALARGDAAEAERHARFVLQQDATDEGGLALWTSIQARRSPLLGLWWRWNVWFAYREDAQQVAVAIASFVAVRALVIVTDELGYELISRVLSLAWLGFCAYTWVAPALFRKWLQRELSSVKLAPDF